MVYVIPRVGYKLLLSFSGFDDLSYELNIQDYEQRQWTDIQKDQVEGRVIQVEIEFRMGEEFFVDSHAVLDVRTWVNHCHNAGVEIPETIK